MWRGLLSWRGALAAVLVVAGGCNYSTSTTTPQVTQPAKPTAKQEGTTPANTMKEPGHIPGG